MGVAFVFEGHLVMSLISEQSPDRQNLYHAVGLTLEESLAGWFASGIPSINFDDIVVSSNNSSKEKREPLLQQCQNTSKPHGNLKYSDFIVFNSVFELEYSRLIHTSFITFNL